MALDGTYSGLQASVADFLNRTDLTSTIPDFIVIAEADLNRKLRVRLQTTMVNTSITTQYETQPSDFAGVVSMWNTNGDPLNTIAIDALVKLAATGGGTGNVTDVAVIGTTFAFYPAPTAAQTVTMAYYQRIPALLANPGGNWLLTAHPDAYLYAALTAAAPYLQDDNRIPVWASLYQNAVQGILAADGERYGSRLVAQPSPTQIV